MVKRRKELWVRTANVLALLSAVCGFFLLVGFPITMWGLPFAAFFVFSVRSWVDGVGTRRTAAGRELWSQAGGFHRMLATDSAETRFDFAARKDLYTAYVPFAVAAGAAALWAKKYQTRHGNGCAATGLVPLVVVRDRLGLCRRFRRREFRQLRVGVVVVDRRLHRIAVVVVVAAAAAAASAVAAAAVAAGRRRRIMVRLLLIFVLVLAVLVLIGFVLGYNKIRTADVRVAEALSGIDVELTRRAR